MSSVDGQRAWRKKGAKMRFSFTIFETRITLRELRRALAAGDLTEKGMAAAQRAVAKLEAALGEEPNVARMREGDDLDHDEE